MCVLQEYTGGWEDNQGTDLGHSWSGTIQGHHQRVSHILHSCCQVLFSACQCLCVQLLSNALPFVFCLKLRSEIQEVGTVKLKRKGWVVVEGTLVELDLCCVILMFVVVNVLIAICIRMMYC